MITVIARAVVSALSDLLVAALSNLWRTAAVLLAVVAVGLFVWLSSVQSDAAVLRSEAKRLAGQVDAARGSALGWETEARDAQLRLADWVRRYEVDTAKARAAVADAERRESDAGAALRAWTQRYADALRDEDCGAVMRMQICERLRTKP